MNKVTGYKLCRGADEAMLEKDVNEAIKAGWQPHGPMVCAAASPGTEQYDWFYQPMVCFGSGGYSASEV